MILDDFMWVYGGYSADYFNDLHKLHLSTMQWEEVPSKGKKPLARTRHTTFMYNGSIYVFGGQRDRGDIVYNDIHVVNADLAVPHLKELCIHFIHRTGLSWSGVNIPGDLEEELATYWLPS